MFARLEPAARQALVDARNEARRSGQDQIRAEHLLLGLLTEPGPAAEAVAAAGLDLAEVRARVRSARGAGSALDSDALASLGIDLDAVRRATDSAFGNGALDRVTVPGRRRLQMADGTRRSLIAGMRQAESLGQRRISSGHLLIGIIDQPGNAATILLAQAGADIEGLRSDVMRRITAAA